MKDKPIIFSTEMVKAILDGRKTQTRRVIKPQFSTFWENAQLDPQTLKTRSAQKWRAKYGVYIEVDMATGYWKWIWCPYGKCGDILWVRETFRHDDYQKGEYIYKADIPQLALDEAGDTVRWKPSIHMPKKACRLKLKIKNIGVERIQDISFEDVLAEGVKEQTCPKPQFYTKMWFAHLWDKINKKRGFGWDKNPFVWKIEFEKLST